MDTERLWTPEELAALFRVDARTVTKWAREGRIERVIRTPGGGIRVRDSEVNRLIAGEDEQA